MKLWQGVVLGVAAWLVFVVAMAPASKLQPLVHKALPQLHLSGVHGSVWSGGAAVVTAPPVQLQDVRWRLRPLALLLGRAEVALEGQLRGRALQGRAGRSLFGRPYLSQVQGSVAVQDVLSWLQRDQVGLTGAVDFALNDVRWSDARFPAVDGTLNWSPAGLVRPTAVNFGKVQLVTAIEDGATRGRLEATGGDLQVQGTLELEPAGSYRLQAQIQQKGNVPAEVSGFLSNFTEFRNGSYLFEWSDAL